MSIMDMFRNAVQKVNSPQLDNNPDNKQTPDPDNKQQQQQQTQTPQSPLEQFADLFKNDPDVKQKSDEAPQFNIDPTKIAEAASKTDFTKQLPADVLKKVAAGGEEAIGALSAALNSVSQNTYAQSTLVTAKLIEQALNNQAKYFKDTVIPEVVRQVGSDQSLRETNPTLNHPAIAPVADAIKAQLSSKHPDASPKEIAKMTNDFFTALSSAVNPDLVPRENNSRNRGQQEQDWSKFLS